MHKVIFKYIFSFILIGSIFLIFINFIILPLIANKNKEIYIPDVKGLHIHEATKILDKFSIKTFYIDYIDGYNIGEVLSTSPRAFTKVKEGRELKITVIAAKEDIIINNLINNSLRSAELYFDRNNIPIDTVIYEYNEKYKNNIIITQYPKEGNKITDETKITLVVSLGMPPDYYIVPDLINLSLNKGKVKINESGLLIGNIHYEYVDTLLNNTIIQQDQPAYKRLSMPLEINLTISKDTKYE